MRRCVSIAMVLLLLTAAMPAMACATGRAMNRVESSCCRAAQNMCRGSAQRGCCRMELRSRNPESTAQAPASHVTLVTGWAVLGASSMTALLPDDTLASTLAAESHSPPIGSMLQPVLRI